MPNLYQVEQCTIVQNTANIFIPKCIQMHEKQAIELGTPVHLLVIRQERQPPRL